MDASWAGKVVRFYHKDGVNLKAMKAAAALNDPRIVDAEIAEPDEEGWVTVVMPFLKYYKTVAYHESLVHVDEFKSDVTAMLAEHGLVATDFHTENIMWDPWTGDIKVIDYEQFRYIRSAR